MQATPTERRRSRRQLVDIPATIRGVDSAGRSFFERTKVVLVDEHGARLRTGFGLGINAEMELIVPDESKWRRLRVIWVGSAGSLEEGMVGLEFVDKNESWDLHDLRDRWRMEGS